MENNFDHIQEKPPREINPTPIQDNISPNDPSNAQQIPVGNIPLKKKNRTLQFYKFLFYSIKVEIKLHEFLDLVRFSNQSEIVLWILSFILYLNTPGNLTTSTDETGRLSIKYKHVFIWIHIIHALRGIVGFFIWRNLPRSYQIVEALKGTPDGLLEKKLFNDLARSTINDHLIKPINDGRIYLYIYLGLTFVNIVFDIIDFIAVLSNLHLANNESVVILLTYLIIALLYISKYIHINHLFLLVIDFSYIFWGGSLKYSFPPSYFAPIADAFSGTVNRAMIRFKLKKPSTDIKKEAEVQAQGNNQQQQEPQLALPQLNDQIVSGNNNVLPYSNQFGQGTNLPNEVRIDLQ